MLTEEELNNLEEFNGPEINGVSANADAWEVNAMVSKRYGKENQGTRSRKRQTTAATRRGERATRLAYRTDGNEASN